MDIFVKNYVALSLNIGLLIHLITGKLFDKKTQKLLFIAIVTVILTMLSDCVDYYLSLGSVLNNLRYISTILGYLLKVTTIVVILNISLERAEYRIYSLVPIAILTVALICTPFTKIVFYFNENNVFCRGALSFLPQVVSIYYLVILVFMALKKYSVIDIGKKITICYFVATSAVAIMLETIGNEKFLITGAMATGCAVYYLYLYVQLYKVDALSGLLNRKSFYIDAEKMSNKQVAVISVDLNNLKIINDTEGHSAGDKAICSVANIMVEIASSNFLCYRIGGDEFMILGENRTIEEAKEFICNAKERLKETKYSAALGCALYTPEDDFEEVCKNADKAMYKDKSEYKSDIKK